MTMSNMLPSLSVDDALNGADRHAVGSGNLRLGVATIRPCSDGFDVLPGQLGSRDRFPSRNSVRDADTFLRIGFFDVFSLRAKPEMRWVTTRRIIAGMKHANAFRPKPADVSERLAGRKLIGDTMSDARFTVPPYGAVTVAVEPCAHERPASVRRADHDASPKTLGVSICIHNASVAGGA